MGTSVRSQAESSDSSTRLGQAISRDASERSARRPADGGDPSDARRRLDAVLAAAPLVVWQVDRSGVFVLAEGKGLERLRLRPGDLLGRPLWEVWRDAPAVCEAIRRALAGEALRRTVDIRGVHFETSFTPLRDAGGTVTGVMGVATAVSDREQDLHRRAAALEAEVQQRLAQARREHAVLQEQILERRRMAEALRESEDKWWSLVQQVPDFILTVSPDGIIQFLNHAEDEQARQEVIGAPVGRYVPEEHQAGFQEMLQRVFEHGESVSFEVRARRRDGSLGWFSARVGPVRRGERVAAAVVVATDVTRQREAEEELRRRQFELAHMARVLSIGEMSSILAHELKTPLAAISNYAAGCVRRLTAGQIQPEDLIDAVEEIRGQSRRAGETIDRIRKFLQKRAVEHAPLRLETLVDEALALVDAELRRQEVKVVRETGAPLPRVLADGVQIQQVLVNLLMNAVEAMEQTPPAGRVLVIRTEACDQDVTVAVCDAGCGLPDDPERLFESFETTKPHGLGIGLSISRSIVEAHGGWLRCGPNAGRGATFQFSLPVWGGEGR